MRVFHFIAVLGLLVIAGAGQAKAQIETYTFDKAHTQILFFVNHLGFSNSQGEFHDYDGSFTFDRGEPEK
ncbi:MAG: YceI family protein [Bdellovibrionales bacterium]